MRKEYISTVQTYPSTVQDELITEGCTCCNVIVSYTPDIIHEPTLAELLGLE